MRTRIKICGITRESDADACVEAGADALGFVFYPPSPRYVEPHRAAELIRRLPPFVCAVGLFVNADRETILRTVGEAPLGLLQFHGDEPADFCAGFDRPYIRAARVRPGLDLLQFASAFATAQGILCDAYVEGFGGGGQTFDWSLIPERLPRPLVLSGGLDAANVTAALHRLRPAAVDVSSGVEVSKAAKGIKDHAKVAAFIAKVREADESVRPT